MLSFSMFRSVGASLIVAAVMVAAPVDSQAAVVVTYGNGNPGWAGISPAVPQA